jgi:hypothetical protein
MDRFAKFCFGLTLGGVHINLSAEVSQMLYNCRRYAADAPNISKKQG